jgi:hypothetical protein
MASLLKLYVDTQRDVLVSGLYSERIFTLPKFTQADILPVELFLLQPANAGVTRPYDVILESKTVTITLCAPSATSPTVHAQIVLTGPDSTGKYVGNLDLTTAAINTLVSGAGSSDATCRFQVKVSGGGIYGTEAKQTATVEKSGTTAASVGPAPSSTYLTSVESIATFALRYMAAGASIIWESEDTTKKCLQYLDNNGVMRFDPIT